MALTFRFGWYFIENVSKWNFQCRTPFRDLTDVSYVNILLLVSHGIDDGGSSCDHFNKQTPNSKCNKKLNMKTLRTFYSIFSFELNLIELFFPGKSLLFKANFVSKLVKKNGWCNEKTLSIQYVSFWKCVDKITHQKFIICVFSDNKWFHNPSGDEIKTELSLHSQIELFKSFTTTKKGNLVSWRRLNDDYFWNSRKNRSFIHLFYAQIWIKHDKCFSLSCSLVPKVNLNNDKTRISTNSYWRFEKVVYLYCCSRNV